jgi:hypothetical protein
MNVAEATRDELLREAYKRGLLSDDMKVAYEEAQKRGLVGGTASVAQEIRQGQTVSGEAPVKSTLQSAAENFIPSAVNMAKGAVSTAVGAGTAMAQTTAGLVGAPGGDVAATPKFIKDLAIGTWEGLKQRYGNGLQHAIATDPVGVIADALSVAGVVRGGVRLPTAASKVEGLTPAARRAATEAERAGIGNQARPQEGLPIDQPAAEDLVERLGQTSEAGRKIIEPFLTERQKCQLSRVSESLKTFTGTTKSATQATTEAIKRQRDSSAPLYKAAYEAGDKIVWSDEMERLSGVPEVQTAMKNAVSDWQRSQIAQGFGAAKPGATANRGGILEILGNKVPVFPNIQFWDYVKKSLDGMISDEIKPNGSLSGKGRELTTIKNKLLDQLDKQVPQYAQARQAWAGEASYLKALDDGRGILTKSESGRLTLSGRPL